MVEKKKRKGIAELKAEIKEFHEANIILAREKEELYDKNKLFESELYLLRNDVFESDLLVRNAKNILDGCITRMSKTSDDRVNLVFLHIVSEVLDRKSVREILINGVEVASKKTSVLRLVKTGEQKINVIKAIREFTKLGLKEAKEASDFAGPGGPGFNLMPYVEAPEDIVRIRRLLENAGATVEVA